MKGIEQRYGKLTWKKYTQSAGVVKNNNTTSQGIDEIETGRFSAGTKNSEEFAPGTDHEARRGI
jgi:hypothetical protein